MSIAIWSFEIYGSNGPFSWPDTIVDSIYCVCHSVYLNGNIIRITLLIFFWCNFFFWIICVPSFRACLTEKKLPRWAWESHKTRNHEASWTHLLRSQRVHYSRNWGRLISLYIHALPGLLHSLLLTLITLISLSLSHTFPSNRKWKVFLCSFSSPSSCLSCSQASFTPPAQFRIQS